MEAGERFAEARAGRRILVIGDCMLDRYVYGHAQRVSPEAPAIVMAAQSQEAMPGGAANVAVNVAALGAGCVLVGLTGEDAESADLRRTLAAWPGIEVLLAGDETRRTTVKTRFVSPQHQTHLLRVDWETTDPPPPEAAARLRTLAQDRMEPGGLLVLSDYGKGVLSERMVRDLIEAARARGMIVLVDPKGSDFTRYRGATLITPNLAELGAALGRFVPQEDAAVEAAAGELSRRTGIADILVKRHGFGVHLVQGGRTSLRLPALARTVRDVSGAGDTILSTLAVALSAGAEIGRAVRWANAAAAVVVGKPGTAAPTRREIDDLLAGEDRPARKRFADCEALVAQVRAWRQAGLSVGLTNGCFDLLHPGHVALLARARAGVDRLIVAINGDASIRALKGPARPILDVEARAAMLAALDAVSALVVFDEPTPLAIIEAVRPDILFKGSDYALDDVVGRREVEAHGGRVVLIERDPAFSTTGLVQRILSGGRGAP